MKKFKDFINEGFDSKIYAYHYSHDEFEDGFVLDSPKRTDRKFGVLNCFEIALEQFRTIFKSKAISRLNCLFSSPYRNNRFSNYGNCYLVEVIGSYTSVDSRIIDNLQTKENLSKTNRLFIESDYTNETEIIQLWSEIMNNNISLVKDYWNGKLGDKKDIEILSNSLKIIEKVQIKENIFEVVKDFKIDLRLLYDFDKLSKNEINQVKNSIDYNNKIDYYQVIEGILKKGSKFVLKSNKKIQLLNLSEDFIHNQNNYIHCALFSESDLKNCRKI